MPDIFSIIKEADEESKIESGVIESDLGKGRYQVRVKGRFINIRSAVNEKLKAGQRVVINRTENNKYIIGSMGWVRTQNKKEFIVDV